MSCPGAGFAFLVACSRADAEAGEDHLQCFGYFRRNRHRSPDGPAACQREAGALLEPVSDRGAHYLAAVLPVFDRFGSEPGLRIDPVAKIVKATCRERVCQYVYISI